MKIGKRSRKALFLTLYFFTFNLFTPQNHDTELSQNRIQKPSSE
jgi:hypothetical protein